MGRTINGSYAQFTCSPATHVIPIHTDLSWELLAPIPESYATAWTCLHGNLAIEPGQILLIRGATSALGQAALNIAAHDGAHVIASTRNPQRLAVLKELGAEHAVLEGPDLSRQVREIAPHDLDAVLDLVGNTTILDSLTLLRRHGRMCEAGWLGGLAPVREFNPLLQMPSGVHFSLFGSFMFGQPGFPLCEVPMQAIVDRAAAGIYKARPARVFRFAEIADAHRLMGSNQANGKIIVVV